MLFKRSFFCDICITVLAMRKIITGSFLFWFCVAALAYGPDGHEIVGGIADKRLANTPTAAKIAALLDGLTLQRAATIPDDIKSWDRKGADDLTAYPHFSQKRIEEQLRAFWMANPPTDDPQLTCSLASLVSLHRRSCAQPREIR